MHHSKNFWKDQFYFLFFDNLGTRNFLSKSITFYLFLMKGILTVVVHSDGSLGPSVRIPSMASELAGVFSGQVELQSACLVLLRLKA